MSPLSSPFLDAFREKFARGELLTHDEASQLLSAHDTLMEAYHDVEFLARPALPAVCGHYGADVDALPGAQPYCARPAGHAGPHLAAPPETQGPALPAPEPSEAAIEAASAIWLTQRLQGRPTFVREAVIQGLRAAYAIDGAVLPAAPAPPDPKEPK